jgi:hypothetical protein
MTHPGRTISIVSLAAGCLALAGTASAQTTAQMPVKLKKQISVMEKIVDEMLVDSKNVLVHSHEPTRGIYLPEFGVLFTFEASMLTPDRGEWWKDFSKSFKVETKDGKTIVHMNDDDDDSDAADLADKAEKTAKDAKKKHELTRKELLKDRQERYENAKKELKGVLLDYGYTLTGLREDQVVAIAAYFDDDDIFGESENETVILRARMSDLRASEAGRLSNDQMLAKISVEEY